MTEAAPTGPEGWVILELMGHRRLAGYLTDVEVGGGRMLRIDVPTEPPATQFYNGAAVYCITPTSEGTARAVAQASSVAPVSRWELPAGPSPAGAADVDDDDSGDWHR